METGTLDLSKKSRLLARVKRKLLSRYIYLLRAGLILLISSAVILIFLVIKILLRESGLSKYINWARLFISSPTEQVQANDNKTNILLLGKGGEGHAAPDLTDTIMVVSITHSNSKDPKINMISLPRDIWIESMRAKVNSAYYWGKQKKEKGGLILAKSVVEEIVGIPIHYGAVVDFSGFKKVIDVIGGIDVEVERTFEDKKFPITGKENEDCEGDPEFSCRYETVRFVKGLEHMDGERALKYVRSRYSEDLEEGTDVARARRQQKVISAIKNTILSRETLFSYKKIKELKNLTSEIVESDIPEDVLVILARRFYDSQNNVKSYSIPENLLENPKISPKHDNQYVFIPKSGNWQGVHEWIKSL